MRLDKKWDSLEDVKKSDWYIQYEIFKRSFLTKDQYSTPPLTDVDSSWKQDVAKLDNQDTFRLDKVWSSARNIKKIVGLTPGHVGRAMLYIWLADLDFGIENLKIARTYIQAEIKLRETQTEGTI
jgi:hypothetical protein